MSEPWLRSTGADLFVRVHVQPGARVTAIVGTYGDALKVKLAAPPVDGKANACLLAFFAERLGIARSQVELAGGAASRRKLLRISGTHARVVEALTA